MDGARVRLTSEKEPYLLTLYGKALDSREADSILGDTFADAAVRRIDFDFEKLKLPKGGSITLPLRARHLDGWTREFLAANPESTVLHLGCGLDTRVYRIDPPPAVRWYDVDMPDVIDLRRRLYQARPGYQMIASSVTDPRWLEGIPADRPVLVVAEGLVMYLNEKDGVALLNRITNRFPHGQVVFDAYSRLTVWLITLGSRLISTGVTLRWGIEDVRALARRVDRLELVDEVPFLTMPDLVARLGRTRVQRVFFRLVHRFAFFRNSIRHLRFRF